MPRTMMWVYDDGGRTAAGFRGETRDCVTRSIAIATERPYLEVYDALNALAAKERTGKRKRTVSSSRLGVHTITQRRYLTGIGWTWTPTMHVGEGCTVHLREDEIPNGRLVVKLSRHLTAVVDGVIRDTHDPSRDGTRCVYGWWQAP